MSEIDERLPRAAVAAMPAAPEPGPGPRQTLAMRLAERNGQRELRAARLARLRAAGAEDPATRATGCGDPVLEVYLPATPAAGPRHDAPGVETILAAPDELGTLPGVGPGLAAALRRAGLAGLADLAGLEPAALAARLGPIGRLIPAARWIAVARAADPGTAMPAAARPETAAG